MKTAIVTVMLAILLAVIGFQHTVIQNQRASIDFYQTIVNAYDAGEPVPSHWAERKERKVSQQNCEGCVSRQEWYATLCEKYPDYCLAHSE